MCAAARSMRTEASSRRRVMAVSSSQREPKARANASGRLKSNPLLKAIDEISPSLENLFARIGRETHDEVGVTRDAYGAKETLAGDILIDYAKSHGLDAGYDRVG